MKEEQQPFANDSFGEREFEGQKIPKAVIKRLSLYSRVLQKFSISGLEKISSKELGDALGLNSAQVRKDLAYFGQFGVPGLGYYVEDLRSKIKSILGTDRTWNVLLVGAGNIGRALSSYRGFGAKGFQLVAVFDNDPSKVGKKLGPFVIQPLADMPAAVEKHAIRLAIIAVPADAAQDVADQLIAAGVRGLMNFAPVSISVPPDIALNAVDVAVQLEQLSFQVNVTGVE